MLWFCCGDGLVWLIPKLLQESDEVYELFIQGRAHSPMNIWQIISKSLQTSYRLSTDFSLTISGAKSLFFFPMALSGSKSS